MSDSKGKEPTIVCRCMDVTADEMKKAFEMMVKFLGTTDVNTYRRITSATTGYCQGRACLQHLQKILYSLGKSVGSQLSADELLPKRRAPLQPTPIGVFAKMAKEGRKK